MSTVNVSEGPVTQIESDKLTRAVDLAYEYLVDSCGVDGRFVYRRYMDGFPARRPFYNMLRHCGAIYAMTEYEMSRGLDRASDAVCRAVGFLQDVAIAPLAKDPSFLGVWSPRGESGRGSDAQVKLGGLGLGLLALANTERLDKSIVDDGKMFGLACSIELLQKPDGSFFARYIHGHSGPDEKLKSLFYPGEAALGLLAYHAIHPMDNWIESAISALDYLAKLRAPLETSGSRSRATSRSDTWCGASFKTT